MGREREKTQHFYNHVLGQWGDAPYFCESWINRAVVMQHLYSPAMWSIFQLQDILGMSETLRRENRMKKGSTIPPSPNITAVPHAYFAGRSYQTKRLQ
ncbi:MAG: hypothetical protein WDO16_07185 [Bacteroidota bacterium]